MLIVCFLEKRNKIENFLVRLMKGKKVEIKDIVRKKKYIIVEILKICKKVVKNCMLVNFKI